MFVFGTSKWRTRGGGAIALLAPLNRSRFPFRASSVRIIFLLKVSVLNSHEIYVRSVLLAIPRLEMFKWKSALLILGSIASGRMDRPFPDSSRIKLEIWELPCSKNISLSYSSNTKKTITTIIIIIPRLSQNFVSRSRKLGSRRFRALKARKRVWSWWMRGAESEMMNARWRGEAFKTRSLHGCLLACAASPW